MKTMRRHEPVPTTARELPEPRPGARWRWAKPRSTLGPPAARHGALPGRGTSAAAVASP